MERTAMAMLAIGASLLAASAEARTGVRVCRTECAPRIKEQCGSLQGQPRRACQRQLTQACRQSTPAAACTTTGDMTLALADRSFALGAASGLVGSDDLTLCGDGRFTLGASAGTWVVTIAGGELVLNLEAAASGTGIVDGTSNTILFPEARQFRVAPGGANVVLFDGLAVDGADAGAACGAGGAPGGVGRSDARADGGPELGALTDALADRALVAVGRRTTVLVLCASSRYAMEVSVSAAPGPVLESTGSWSVALADGQPVLTLVDDTGESRRVVVASDAGGGLLLDGLAVSEGDRRAVRGICARL